MAVDRGRAARARVLARDLRGRPLHPGEPPGADHRPRLLPVRVLADLHGPAERSTRRSSRTSPSAARRSTASPATPSGPSRRSARSSAITIEQLSDFEPKGAACRAFGVLHPGGFPERALVMTGPDGVVLWSHQAEIARRAARREPDLRRPRRRRGLSELTSAPPPGARSRRPRAGPGGRAAGDRLRRLRVPVLRRAGGAPARARAARDVPALPGALEPPARAGRRAAPPRRPRCRARSGPSTTRCSPTRAAWRTRTCGPAPRRSGSTSRASTPTAAPTRSPSGCARTSAAASARAWRRRRRCSPAASATPAGPARSCGRRCASLDPGSNRGQARAVYPRAPWPPATSSSSSACAPTRPARRCAPSTGPTRASCTASR